MASTYAPGNPPDDPKQIPAFLRRELLNIKRALEDAEPNAKLQIIGVAPERYADGDEFEVNATVGAASPFGAGAGRYIVRAGVPVFIG